MVAKAGCLLMGFILYSSGVRGGENISVLKGSSVELPCSAEDPTSKNRWFTVTWNGADYILKEIPANGSRVKYNMSDSSQPTLKIKDLTLNDGNIYCCRKNTENPKSCWEHGILLIVAELQVKVIPSTEEQTVSLMCQLSKSLTQSPKAYNWYQKGLFLYQDSSPWYQQLVYSDKAVRYSCSIKGYDNIRAPEVSVDSVTATCFTVTYANGRMCSDKKHQTPTDQSCSITYPREVRIHRIGTNDLQCNTSCTQNDDVIVTKSGSYTPDHSVSCGVFGHQDLQSAEICLQDEKCWSVNYDRRRICALKGSSVNMTSQCSYPKNQTPKYKGWRQIRFGQNFAQPVIQKVGRVEYHENKENHHILTITNLTKNDSAEYKFILRKDDGRWVISKYPAVTLVVTDLTVKVDSAVVTEGQRVTLSCTTSCPLPDNTYIWYFNGQPLKLTGSRNKQLVLDPVGSQHAGKYSCGVKTSKDIKSREEILTVQSVAWKWTTAAAASICAVLLVFVLLTVFFCLRKKRTSSQTPRAERLRTRDQVEQSSRGADDDVSAQPEMEDLQYSSVDFLKKADRRSLLQRPVPNRGPTEDNVQYDVLRFQRNTNP